jgi:DNA-directed RNA polymerase specialized sigma24 family protein
MKSEDEFDAFVRLAEPRLRRALLGAVGVDRVDDAVAEALGYAYEHRQRLADMTNPIGYLFRVGQSRTRRRKSLRLFRTDVPIQIPDVEPRLIGALQELPDAQRIAVWLAHGCAWSHAEIADVLDVSSSTVATHVSRGLQRLRTELGVTDAHH